MSGHSKWHSIKHQKGAADAARLFEDDEVLDACLAQLDSGAHAARAGADNDDAMMLWRGGHKRISRRR